LGAILLFVYVFLPYLNSSFGILQRMSTYLDENGIDPTRYYYTDVEQVEDAEDYLESVLAACNQEAVATAHEVGRFSNNATPPPDAKIEPSGNN